MSYSYITLADARQQLAQKLYDTGANLFWGNAEKDQLIIEAVRTWNSHTSFWRSEFVFSTVVNQTWYDLPSQVGSLRQYTVTDNEIIQQIERHLLEPITSVYPLAWTGSAQFSVSDILNAVQRIRDEVISVTGCTITQRLVAAALMTRTFLPDTVVDIRRIAWLPVAGQGYNKAPLWPSDQWGEQSYHAGFTNANPGTPSTYRSSNEPPLSFDVDIVPAIPGQYDVLSVDNGMALSTAASSLLGVPDDFSWVIKWGVLADLLGRESNAKDAVRANYCLARYKQGLALLLTSPALLYARLVGSPLSIDSVQNADNYRPGWQNEAAGQPDLLMIAGLNLIGLAPLPSGVQQISAMVVQNAPVSTNPGSFIQVGRDDFDAILNYAQHMAMFKVGGAEFLATIPLFQKFVKKASLYNSKLSELGEYTEAVYSTSQLQVTANPVYVSDDPVSS